jgi:hypothetical protein
LVRGCAAVSAILAFGMAVQYMTYPASSLCAAIELSTPLLGKLAQAPMKRPTAAVEYLSIVELAGHEAAIQQWLSTEPDMGCKRLCTKMLAEKKLHVTPATARNYLLRLKREPATPRRKKRRSIRGSDAAADGTSESAARLYAPLPYYVLQVDGVWFRLPHIWFGYLMESWCVYPQA